MRLFLEHKAEAGLASLTDEQFIEGAPVLFETLMEVCVQAWRKHDRAAREPLRWFTHACDEEFDERRAWPPKRRPLH